MMQGAEFEDLVGELGELLDAPNAYESFLDDPALEQCVEESNPDESKSTSKKNERMSNAERCRKHRERKRAEKTKIFVENANLKRERKEMLEQITELEYQAQALRGQGYMDLTVENELLRQEIKKHRQYVQKIVDLTENGGLDTTEEEHNRAMKSCVESGIGQMVGLSYSSLVDPTWVEGQPITMVLDENRSVQCQVRVRYQCLPLGSNPSNALRINRRFDFIGFPVCAQRVNEYIAEICTDEAKLKQQYEAIRLPYNVEIDQVFPSREIGGSSFGCFRYIQTNEGTKLGTIMVFSSKELAMHSGAFRADCSSAGERGSGTRLVKVHASSSCKLLYTKGSESEEDVQHLKELVTNSLIVQAVGPNSCDMTKVGTIATRLLEGLPEPPLSEDGQLSENHKRVMTVFWQKVYQDCLSRK